MTPTETQGIEWVVAADTPEKLEGEALWPTSTETQEGEASWLASTETLRDGFID